MARPRLGLLATTAKPEPLAGRTAVITGAGSGIGRALAVRLAAHDCPLAIVDADADALAQTAAAIRGPVFTRELDVRDRQGQLAFAADVVEWSPAPIGAVFNNAGVVLSASVAEASPQDEEWVWSVNFIGVVNGVRAFLPPLLEQGSGAIVNTSSLYGLASIPSKGAYCASKFAVRGFTEALRHELAGSGVRAVTVYPGGTKTNIARNAYKHADPAGLDPDAERMVAEFERMARTTAERAAEVIHVGVDAGRARILVGRDARLLDALVRISPTGYYGVIAMLTRARGG